MAALALFVASWLVVTLVISVALLAGDVLSGRITLEQLAQGVVTPNLFLANNLALAMAVPLSYLAHWAAFGQRPRWLSSVVGSFRWPLLLRFSLVAAPFYLVSLAVEGALAGGFEGLAVNPDTWFLAVAIVLTTPFQAAGEELTMRGLLARSVASYFASRRVGLVVAAAISSLVFMGLHRAADPWLNLFYFVVGLATSVLVWRTGGLEAAVALHAVNNLVSEVTLPFADLGGLFDRGVGSGSPWVLAQVAVVMMAAGLMLLQAKRLNLPTATAPASQVAHTMELGRDGWGAAGLQYPTADKGVR